MNKPKNANFVYIICLFKILFFVGCKKNKINYKQNLNVCKNIKVSENLYKLKIEGIECKVCARAAIQIIESNDNVQKAEFKCINENFENCYVNLYLKDQHVNIEKIISELKNEGFILQSISGQFIGKFVEENKTTIFKIQDSKINAKIKCNVGQIIKYNEQIIVHGRLEKIDSDNYILYLDNLY